MKTFNKVCLFIAILIAFAMFLFFAFAPAVDITVKHLGMFVGADFFFGWLAFFPLP